MIKNDMFPWKLYTLNFALGRRSQIRCYTPLVASYVVIPQRVVISNAVCGAMSMACSPHVATGCALTESILSRRLKVTGVLHSPLQSTYRSESTTSDAIILSKFTYSTSASQTYNGLNDLITLLSDDILYIFSCFKVEAIMKHHQ